MKNVHNKNPECILGREIVYRKAQRVLRDTLYIVATLESDEVLVKENLNVCKGTNVSNMFLVRLVTSNRTKCFTMIISACNRTICVFKMAKCI